MLHLKVLSEMLLRSSFLKSPIRKGFFFFLRRNSSEPSVCCLSVLMKPVCLLPGSEAPFPCKSGIKSQTALSDTTCLGSPHPDFTRTVFKSLSEMLSVCVCPIYLEMMKWFSLEL